MLKNLKVLLPIVALLGALLGFLFGKAYDWGCVTTTVQTEKENRVTMQGDIKEMRADIGTLKTDVSVTKRDVSDIKNYLMPNKTIATKEVK